MVAAFSLGCFMVMYEDVNIPNYIKKTILSFSMLYLALIYFMVGGLFTIIEYMFKLGFEGLGEYFKIYILLSLILFVFISFLCAVFALAMFGIKKASKIITSKINNRIFQIFIYMVIMVILVVIFLLILPYLTIVLGTIKCPLKITDTSYHIYIWAFPIQQLIIYLWFKQLNIYSYILLSIFITVLISYISYYLTEYPFKKRR